MNVHKNARLTPRGRVLMVERIEAGLPVGRAAAAAGVSERTAHRWLKRWRAGDRELGDRSSAPRRCPHRLRPAQVARIEQLRRQRLTSAAIAGAPQMAVSTVGLALRRLATMKTRAPSRPIRGSTLALSTGLMNGGVPRPSLRSLATAAASTSRDVVDQAAPDGISSFCERRLTTMPRKVFTAAPSVSGYPRKVSLGIAGSPAAKPQS
jgi:transposase